MPKHLRPLRPEDGPEARFALALRALRDRAGADDEAVFSVDIVSRRTGVSRQTIYSALSGRIPNRGTLAKIVRAWNGDVAAWIEMKTATENEIQLARSDPPVENSGTNSISARDREIARWKARNLARKEKRAKEDPYFGPGKRHVSPQSAQANSLVQEFARDLNSLRQGAGMSLRQVVAAVESAHPETDYLRVSVTTLSYMFRGLRFPDWFQVSLIVPALGGDLEEWRVKWVAMARTTELRKRSVDEVEARRW